VRGVEWQIPEFSRSQVDAAGQTLIDRNATVPEYRHALDVINNWRSSHSFPLNTFQMGLRQKAKKVHRKPLVAQRLKRLSSIEAKLRRYSTMKLSQMQDIGGCRAVLPSVHDVRALVQLYEESSLKHTLVRVDDYVTQPKASGYRSMHLIYRYFSDKKPTYNGLQIEMQLRSRLQHAWATAVETAGTFLQQALKSSQGSRQWLRFFALMGSALAMRERTPLVPGTPSTKAQLLAETKRAATKLEVIRRLAAYGAAVHTIEEGARAGARYYLLYLDLPANTLTISGYGSSELARATDDYQKRERALSSSPGKDAVLVSVESISSLRRAYPNYFLETGVFIQAVTQFISQK